MLGQLHLIVDGDNVLKHEENVFRRSKDALCWNALQEFQGFRLQSFHILRIASSKCMEHIMRCACSKRFLEEMVSYDMRCGGEAMFADGTVSKMRNSVFLLLRNSVFW